MENRLVTWILQQAKTNNYSFRELGRRAKMSHSHVTKILNGEREVSWDFCLRMSKVFDQPVWDFFMMGGLLPNIPDQIRKDDRKRVLLEIFDGLPLEAQEEVINFARFKKIPS